MSDHNRTQHLPCLCGTFHIDVLANEPGLAAVAASHARKPLRVAPAFLASTERTFRMDWG